jgi:hypothetical protein
VDAAVAETLDPTGPNVSRRLKREPKSEYNELGDHMSGNSTITNGDPLETGIVANIEEESAKVGESDPAKIGEEDIEEESAKVGESDPAKIGEEDIEEESAKVGESDPAKVGSTLNYDPFANVGANIGKVIPMPTLAKAEKPIQISQLEWYKSDGKPPAPTGFYWQASGSKTAEVGTSKRQKKGIVAGWLLIRNGKCAACKGRNRPPVCYLKGSAWNTLRKESYERQKAEIKLLLGKSRQGLNSIRCPKCLSRHDGARAGIGQIR